MTCCPVCGSHAIYRNADGSLYCATCDPKASWRDFLFKPKKLSKPEATKPSPETGIAQ